MQEKNNKSAHGIWYLLFSGATKAQASLRICICADSSEYSLLTYISINVDEDSDQNLDI